MILAGFPMICRLGCVVKELELLSKEVIAMRVLPTVHQMGYLVIPVLLVVATAFIWIASKLLPYAQPKTEPRRIHRAA